MKNLLIRKILEKSTVKNKKILIDELLTYSTNQLNLILDYANTYEIAY